MKNLTLALALLLGISTTVEAQNHLPRGAQLQDQSSYALGSMTWNVVFVEGDGSVETADESWSAAEIANIQTKVGEAKSYWEGLTAGFHQNARLSINVNYANGATPLTTGVEPTNSRNEVWINDVMGSLGYNSSNRRTNVRNYNQDMRIANQTHWAATIFVMDNTAVNNDSYAYAYHGGPYTILTNNAAGWTPANFNMVLAHEMGHIFFAHDEYAASNRRTTDRGGYLNVENGNASRDADGNVITPPQPNALMRNNGNFGTHVPYAPSTFASDMFGHRDTDGDSIPDILDTNPIISGDMDSSDSLLGNFIFNGETEVTALQNNNPLNVGFSNSQSDITINTIASAYYTIDGGDAIMFGAADGDFNDYLESLSFSIDGLAAGSYVIDVYGVNSVDNESDFLRFTFNSLRAVPEPATALIGIATLGFLISRRRRTMA